MISPGQAAFAFYLTRGVPSPWAGQVWSGLPPEAQAFWNDIAKAAIARHIQNQAEDTKEVPTDNPGAPRARHESR